MATDKLGENQEQTHAGGIESLLQQIPDRGLIFNKTLPPATLYEQNPLFQREGKPFSRMNLTKKNGSVLLTVFHDESNQGLIFDLGNNIMFQSHSSGSSGSAHQNMLYSGTNTANYKTVKRTIEALLASRTPQVCEQTCAIANSSFDTISDPSLRTLPQRNDIVGDCVIKINRALEVADKHETKITLTAKLLFTLGMLSDKKFWQNTFSKEAIKQKCLELSIASMQANEIIGLKHDESFLSKISEEIMSRYKKE